MQMLHSVYDLQEAIDQNEWRYILWKSSEFVHLFDPTDVVYDESIIDRMAAGDRHCNTFYQS